MQQESDVSIRRALILGLGEFDPAQLESGERETAIPQLVQWYQDDPDPGIHGASEWLLRQWKQNEKIKAVTKELATGKVVGNRLWYVTREGHTMVIIPGPIEYKGGQDLQNMHIVRGFAIADKDVTVEQYLRFCKECRKDYKPDNQHSPQLDCPVNTVSWYDAAAYCNWLSKQEGIPEGQWCYDPNSHGIFGEDMKILRADRVIACRTNWSGNMHAERKV